jgi:hypothetical protein
VVKEMKRSKLIALSTIPTSLDLRSNTYWNEKNTPGIGLKL